MSFPGAQRSFFYMGANGRALEIHGFNNIDDALDFAAQLDAAIPGTIVEIPARVTVTFCKVPDSVQRVCSKCGGSKEP